MKREDMKRIEQLEEYINDMKKIEKEKGIEMTDFIVISNLGTMSYCSPTSALSLLTMYIRERRNQGVLTDDMIDECVKLTRLSDEDIERLTKEKMKEVLEQLKNGLMGKEKE